MAPVGADEKREGGLRAHGGLGHSRSLVRDDARGAAASRVSAMNSAAGASLRIRLREEVAHRLEQHPSSAAAARAERSADHVPDLVEFVIGGLFEHGV